MMKKLYTYGFSCVFMMMLTGLQACKQSNTEGHAVVNDDSSKLAGSDSGQPLLQYWNTFNFADTLALNNPDIAEQKLVDFIAALAEAPEDLKTQAMNRMLSQAKPHSFAFNYFRNTLEHYLYDPNSPMRSDALYEPVLAFLLDSTNLDEASRLRYRNRLKMTRKNKAGQPATDFRFELPSGALSSFYDAQSPRTLLFFYEPDCSHCQQAIADLKASENFRQHIARKQLNIVAVYAGGNVALWKSYQQQIPATWINGFDRQGIIRKEQLYDLRGSPTVYLLDENKKVLLKDTELAIVDQRLKHPTS
jgi:thiol-disulfide isomerase/thioredoxin